ncbi:MAG: hypothetical protein RMJ89_00820 [Flammeovirgaceae bacterium]|nr:hypothetical protein [Flammeovirgaceae bacterium]
MYHVIRKGIIKDLFPDVLDYFTAIRGFEFLDQELPNILCSIR